MQDANLEKSYMPDAGTPALIPTNQERIIYHTHTKIKADVEVLQVLLVLVPCSRYSTVHRM